MHAVWKLNFQTKKQKPQSENPKMQCFLLTFWYNGAVRSPLFKPTKILTVHKNVNHAFVIQKIFYYLLQYNKNAFYRVSWI